ncbi:MAG: HAD hydrolase family protein [bacterium]|nr:HAD hydrolase family protein [bacterium]
MAKLQQISYRNNSALPIGDKSLTVALQEIRYIVTDVDGVLTNGTINLDGGTSEWKGFSVRDGVGVWLAQQADIEVAILTGRLVPVVHRRANDLGIKHIVGRPINEKADGFLALQQEWHASKEQILYIGDDLIDIPVFPYCGVSVAPADADTHVIHTATAITRVNGGQGVLREVVEAVLHAQNRWDTIISEHFNIELSSPNAS